MGTPKADRRALTAGKRIERLELAVSQLSAALGMLVAQSQDQGCALPGEIGKALTLGAADDRGAGPGASRARRSGPSRKTIDAEPSGLAGAIPRGEAVKQRWVASGELVPARVLAANWGLTPQALGPAARRGEVFALVIKGRRFYPREFLYLDRSVVAAISKALGHLSAVQKLIFFKRPHGALGGRTLLQAMTSADEASGLASVARLATAWADEAPAGAEYVEAA